MLPFFRKIRWRLAADNQFFKYSRYAVGEIVLVVIGILIALQINSWNENRKIEMQVLDLFLEIQRDVILNLESIEDTIRIQSKKDSLLSSILSDTLSADDYNLYPNVRNQIGNYQIPFIQNEGFSKLKNYDNLLPKKYEGIYDSIKQVMKFLERDLVYSQVLKSTSNENNNYFVKNWRHFHVWEQVSRDSVLPEEIIEFFRKNPFYKNMVVQYRFIMDDIRWIDTRIRSIWLYNKLSKTTGVNNLPKRYLDLVHLNHKQYEGNYKFLDSSMNSMKGAKRISVNKGLVEFLELEDDTYFTLVKKDSFARYYNNTLYFKRDSSDKITGAIRYLNGEYVHLEKID